MKRALFCIVFLVLSGTISAQVVFESSLQEAFIKAKEQNKIVFIEYYNSDCPVCKRLGDLLKNDSLVAAYYNKNFISYAMDTNGALAEDEETFLNQANLHFTSVPVLLYFDAKKNFLHHSGVNVDTDHIINEGKKAKHPDYRTSSLKAKYDKGDRTVRTLYAYCDFLLIHKDETMLKKVSQELFESFKKEELPTKKSYIVLKQVIISTDNGFFQYWINNLDNLKDFETGYKAGTEKSYLEKIVLKELNDPTIKKWDTAKKEKYKEYILKLKITDNPEVYFE
ncbi:thioredoxin family protein [Flavobacterium cyclinae]|uniref:thioredoxin family protein n=1 Tax=Flavobacterium cyclinae TaxID=2895947 RepID=UPI001E414D49|nr:thioredoxin fold domain-containing protein [Flavobacterium cyclinae]UGS21006.1 thioredoxin family protein [Flavobacterium cyclinae]